ncbi:MAG: M20 aminoacylase family protein [Bradymonadia bacterium]
MHIPNHIHALHSDMTRWRRDLHAHPETAFEEVRTAERVAEVLQSCPGIEIHSGIARTGVVGTLVGDVEPTGDVSAVALRADMDALHIEECNDFDHVSTHHGRMHACGHDGHTAMLLGAARALAERPDFAGTVHFIFQPAEENEGGGAEMVKEGLFERFPCDLVFGLHNWPGLPAGQIAVRSGPVMAAFDIFEITLTGKGAHAAMPHLGLDPMVVAAQIVTGLQTLVSRRTDPLQAAVITVTQIHGGHTWNVIPEQVTLRGTVRALDPEVHRRIPEQMARLIDGIAGAHEVQSDLRYERRYPATVNQPSAVAIAAAAAAKVVGPDQVIGDRPPSMGAEDFAFMLQARTGCYAWLGAGAGHGLHHPQYDFNDEILPVGAAWWCAVARQALERSP